MSDVRDTYPRVSDIIAKQNMDAFVGIPVDTLAKAAERGDKVHAYCTAWAKNLWIDVAEEEYKPYVDAFINWAEENIDTVIYAEERLYDDDLRFSGKFDMIAKMKSDNKIKLLDIKTSCIKSKTWPVQLAAYAHLCTKNDYLFDNIMNVHLKKIKAAIYEEIEGKKVMTSPPQVRLCVSEYEDATPYWEIFSSALKCYDYFDRKESKNV